MGTSFKTYVVAGIRAEHAIRTEPTKKTVTKYNEDTGEPYQKVVDGPPKVLLFGAHMTDVRTDNPEDVLYAFGKKKPSKLEAFSPGGYEERKYVIGVRIGFLEPQDDPLCLDDDTVARFKGEALMALQQIGYNHGVHHPIGIYVIHYAG